jgi:hypothetical protein
MKNINAFVKDVNCFLLIVVLFEIVGIVGSLDSNFVSKVVAGIVGSRDTANR